MLIRTELMSCGRLPCCNSAACQTSKVMLHGCFLENVLPSLSNKRDRPSQEGLFEDSSPASQDQRLFPVMSGIRSSSLTKMVRYVQGSRVEHVLYAYTKMVCSLAGS